MARHVAQLAGSFICCILSDYPLQLLCPAIRPAKRCGGQASTQRACLNAVGPCTVVPTCVGWYLARRCACSCWARATTWTSHSNSTVSFARLCMVWQACDHAWRAGVPVAAGHVARHGRDAEVAPRHRQPVARAGVHPGHDPHWRPLLQRTERAFLPSP